MQNLLAVYGSPRKGGNSSIFLDYFLQGAENSSGDIERVYLRELNFSPCTECGRCQKTGICVIQDDMVPLYDKLLNYDRLVISCPVFFLGPPAISKAFIDRVQSLWSRKYLLGIDPNPRDAEKNGFFLSVGGFKGSDKIFSCNRSIVRAMFTTCGFRYAGELLFSGIDHFGDLERRDDIKKAAIKAGRDFVYSKA